MTMHKITTPRRGATTRRSAPTPMARLLRLLLPLTFLLASGTIAQAQNVDVQIDTTASQIDASQNINLLPKPEFISPSGSMLTSLATPKGPNYFQVLLQAPYVYDSNPTLAATGIKDSSRFDPSAKLSVQQQFGIVQFTASSAFDVDQYSNNGGANAETWLSSLKVSFGAPDSALKPYLQYQPVLKFNSNYSALKSETNDYGGGAGLALPRVSGVTIQVDFNFLRRYAHSGDSNALTFKPTFGYVSGSEHWRFLFQPNFRVRWYDTRGGISREDETIIAPAIVEYDPTWLKFGDCGDHDICPQGDIEFSVTYTHNFSNIAVNRASQWIVGPTLEFGLSKSWGDKLAFQD